MLSPPCPALPCVSATESFRCGTVAPGSPHPELSLIFVMSCIYPIKLMFGVARAFGVTVCVYCKAVELWGAREDADPSRTCFKKTLLFFEPFTRGINNVWLVTSRQLLTLSSILKTCQKRDSYTRFSASTWILRVFKSCCLE